MVIKIIILIFLLFLHFSTVYLFFYAYDSVCWLHDTDFGENFDNHLCIANNRILPPDAFSLKDQISALLQENANAADVLYDLRHLIDNFSKLFVIPYEKTFSLSLSLRKKLDRGQKERHKGIWLCVISLLAVLVYIESCAFFPTFDFASLFITTLAVSAVTVTLDLKVIRLIFERTKKLPEFLKSDGEKEKLKAEFIPNTDWPNQLDYNNYLVQKYRLYLEKVEKSICQREIIKIVMPWLVLFFSIFLIFLVFETKSFGILRFIFCSILGITATNGNV